MGFEAKFGPESGEARFKVAVERGVEAASEFVRKRFEEAERSRDNLDFHNTVHTGDVVRRTTKILEVVREASPEAVSERDVEIGKLAGGFHDVLQQYRSVDLPEGEYKKTMRQRFAGANEAESGNAAVGFMNQENEKSRNEGQGEIFSGEDMRTVLESIDATVPGFSRENSTVIQPNLKESSSLVARAVALSDLGTAGMEGPGQYLPEGDAVFREENIDILEALQSGEPLDDLRKEGFRNRMLGWTAFQPKFAAGRKALFETEIAAFPEASREALRRLFGKFDDSIKAAEERIAKRSAMSFEDLLKDMGYEIGAEKDRRQEQIAA